MKHAAAALSVLVLAVVTAGALETARGRSALAEAEAAREHGELPLAIAAARVAAEARVPYTGHADAALALLARIGTETNDPATAALAQRVARQAAAATGEPLPAAPHEPTSDGAAAPRPTGTGRGPLALPARIAMIAGAASLLAALLVVWRARAVRHGALLSAAALVLLAVARLWP